MPPLKYEQACLSSHGTWHDGRMSEVEVLFRIYEEALVSAQDPATQDWGDPALGCLAKGASAIVMTAYNPGTARPSWAENEAANTRMWEVLRKTGYEIWRADGHSADGTWREPGWLAWSMPIALGVSIAADFHQFAIYSYDAQGVRSVVACHSDGPANLG